MSWLRQKNYNHRDKKRATERLFFDLFACLTEYIHYCILMLSNWTLITMINLDFKVVARTNDSTVLAKFPYQQIDRWNFGAYLPKDVSRRFWNIPNALRDKPLYLGVIYPVRDDTIVRVRDQYGNYSWVEENGPGGVNDAGTKTAFSKWYGLVFLFDTIEREVSIREAGVTSYGETATVRSNKLFSGRAELSPSGKLIPSSFGLPRESYFWPDLVDACNRYNLQSSRGKPGVLTYSLGVASERASAR